MILQNSKFQTFLLFYFYTFSHFLLFDSKFIVNNKGFVVSLLFFLILSLLLVLQHAHKMFLCLTLNVNNPSDFLTITIPLTYIDS